jgi:hypothetical protein
MVYNITLSIERVHIIMINIFKYSKPVLNHLLSTSTSHSLFTYYDRLFKIKCNIDAL